jgi:UDP-N-acetylmuramate--alanine ligase
MRDKLRRIRTVHFIGIGGVGMGGIAEVLMNLGYRVQGSDLKSGTVTERLKRLGAHIFIGHQGVQLGAADVVVVSSAVDADNPEIVAARQRRIPVVQRAEMLAELMRFRYGIAVAGTHGKTTTTSLVASVLAEGGLDPTFVIGGRLASADTNARLGGGDYLVAEADESDASFLHLQPMLAVVTNIDADHLSSYGGDFEQLQQGFVDFVHNLPFYGLAVICNDDPVVRAMAPQFGRPLVSYGIENGADVRAIEIERSGLKNKFKVVTADDRDLDVTLNLPGMHNIRNALAAVAVGFELGVDGADIAAALASFQGIDRRFEVLGTVNAPPGPITFVDDYGHHPTEIAATISAARDAWPTRRLVVAFQPHRYSRTRDLLDDFAKVLSTVDVLVLTEVYAAGEAPLTGADGRAMARAIRTRGSVDPIFIDAVEDLAATLADIVQAEDVVLTLGAGSIGGIAQELPKQLAVAGPVEVRK